MESAKKKKLQIGGCPSSFVISSFVIAAGRTILAGHGGYVGGSTSKNIAGRWWLMEVKVPFWGDLRLIHLGKRGEVLSEKLF